MVNRFSEAGRAGSRETEQEQLDADERLTRELEERAEKQ